MLEPEVSKATLALLPWFKPVREALRLGICQKCGGSGALLAGLRKAGSDAAWTRSALCQGCAELANATPGWRCLWSVQ